MAEIRLICPGCAAEYRVPDTAIPAEGREVECSACGKVWHARARLDLGDVPPLPAAEPPAQPPADLPPLSRRLPVSVLEILRDEVEHERRARAAEDGDAAASLPRAAVDPEWPATTITRHFEPKPAEAARPDLPEPLLPVPEQPAEPRPAAAPVIDAPEPVLRAAPDRKPGGYVMGFGLAAMLAGAVVALYLLAPRLADQGGLGDGLMQLRASLDGARLWLQDRAATLVR
ncbi:zinc-ribbon domain-containing protein [Paracoccus sp. S3-43]|uniref:zinc-ribbon domain-containing protein n=1 Tax=Paracoccus sp. S3-43 TaxID=3030011 RepID=UPI0023AFD911|nr:zinc-ribbon domain-containing protein [Paracoccus sp. S3-43]WEF23819.1 zinc-ribbon domain-containing protein [Paracoccus sp. S3-43]